MNKIHKKEGKTSAKAHGLKSVLFVDNDLGISTFGKAEKPMVVEQTIDKTTNEKHFIVSKDKQTFESNMDKGQLVLKANKRINGEEENQEFTIGISNKKEVGMDLMGFKPKLELEMFGKNYNDNIHIQIAYNILDLKKIISLHINSVAETIRMVGVNKKDIVGLIESGTPFTNASHKEDSIKNLATLYQYALYYDNVFEIPQKNDKRFNEITANNYNILRVLSMIRQGCAHSGKYKTLFFDYDKDPNHADLYPVAKRIFDKDLAKFNKEFVDHSFMNLGIILNLLQPKDDNSKRKVVNDYYEFTLYKENKNLGFSLQEIRQRIIDSKNFVNDKEAQRIMSKINAIYDYLLFRYYKSNDAIVASLIEKTRASMNDDDKKAIYDEEFRRIKRDEQYLFGLINTTQKCINNYIKEKNIAGKNHKKYVPYKSIIESCTFGTKFEVSQFPACMYVLTKFMDRKEVNELLTSIINKLENITSLIDALKQVRAWDGFVGSFAIFNDDRLSQLIKSFRIVKNLSSSKRKLKKANSKENGNNNTAALYVDAINLLSSGNFLEKDSKLDSFISKDNQRTKGFRNFISSAVIRNRRFAYLIKYIDPKQCHKLVKNDTVLEYIFKSTRTRDGKKEEYLPDSIVESYYKKVCPNSGFSSGDRFLMTRALKEQIKSVDLDVVRKLSGDENRRKDVRVQKEIERQKQLITLYLTIAYLVVKGIVHTNSIYFIAVHAYERDYCYYFDKETHDIPCNCDLTIEYKKNKKKRVQNIIDHNLGELNNCFRISKEGKIHAFEHYRNRIMHCEYCHRFIDYLQDIRNITSFFDIYNYTVQRDILENDSIKANSPLIVKLKSDLEAYRNYQRNFLKVINLMFAYNLPRYKNLTIGDLFNDKYPVSKEAHEEFYSTEN